jgi:2-polyprenyl-3-methyl-5-hydroxy-6-metoxy-1,4-benzoquinol methylase
VGSKSHWENVYRTQWPNELSWHPHLEISLQLIKDAAPNRHAQIIDVGGGESTLIDDLFAREYRNVYVLDVSSIALEAAKDRLSVSANRLPDAVGISRHLAWRYQFDVWHDRAVFHFLTDSKDRVADVRQVAHAVKPGGQVIVATLGPEGPTHCSGLDVVGYGPDSLHDEFGTNHPPTATAIFHRQDVANTLAGTTLVWVRSNLGFAND